MMKKIFAFSVFLAFAMIAISVNAQEDKSDRPSPPMESELTVGKAIVSINYSSPGVKDREIWGALVPYEKVWRTGANEATVFETTEHLIIGDSRLPAGRYSLFTIPGEREWVFIFNSVADQWGSYGYDKSKDVLRIKAIPQKSEEFQERMLFKIEAEDNSGMIYLMWENLRVGFPITSAAK